MHKPATWAVIKSKHTVWTALSGFSVADPDDFFPDPTFITRSDSENQWPYGRELAYKLPWAVHFLVLFPDKNILQNFGNKNVLLKVLSNEN
jgi:hypothetical protein